MENNTKISELSFNQLNPRMQYFCTCLYLMESRELSKYQRKRFEKDNGFHLIHVLTWIVNNACEENNFSKAYNFLNKLNNKHRLFQKFCKFEWKYNIDFRDIKCYKYEESVDKNLNKHFVKKFSENSDKEFDSELTTNFESLMNIVEFEKNLLIICDKLYDNLKTIYDNMNITIRNSYSNFMSLLSNNELKINYDYEDDLYYKKIVNYCFDPKQKVGYYRLSPELYNELEQKFD